jgi:hypothetical protein
MKFNELYLSWILSYKKDPQHALRDASTNLKGFTENLKQALESFSVDYAFAAAIRKTLRNSIARRTIAAQLKRIKERAQCQQ